MHFNERRLGEWGRLIIKERVYRLRRKKELVRGDARMTCWYREYGLLIWNMPVAKECGGVIEMQQFGPIESQRILRETDVFRWLMGKIHKIGPRLILRHYLVIKRLPKVEEFDAKGLHITSWYYRRTLASHWMISRGSQRKVGQANTAGVSIGEWYLSSGWTLMVFYLTAHVFRWVVGFSLLQWFGAGNLNWWQSAWSINDWIGGETPEVDENWFCDGFMQRFALGEKCEVKSKLGVIERKVRFPQTRMGKVEQVY